MRLPFLLLLAAGALPGQFLSFEIGFEDTGCVPCTESLQGRLERVRGVESAELDLEKGVVRLELEAENRVRLGPLRARVTQDGTKITRMAFRAKGVVEEREGGMVFIPHGVTTEFPALGREASGDIEIKGLIKDSEGALTLVIE